MKPLTRARIPQLNPREFKIGNARLTDLNFPMGKRKYFRRYQGEVLHLSVEFEEPLESPVVVVTTDLNSYWGEWQDLAFETRDAKVFTIDIPLKRCGVYRFKLKYTADSGEHCYWLKGAHSYILVDPPAMRTVRMYSMIPTVSGQVHDWIELLKHIRAMNFDTVHCLPLTSLDDSESPYAAHDLFSIDPSYVSPILPGSDLDQLEEFVQTAKSLGLRLCFDLVLNHVGVNSKMVQARPDWFQQDESEADGLKRAGCWHLGEWILWQDLALINFDHPVPEVRDEIRSYMKEYALFWANYAAYTGGMIRYDNLHSSHDGFIHEITKSLRNLFPELIVLAEFFTSEEVFIERVPDWSLNLLQGNSWDYRFAPDLRYYIKEIHAKRSQLKYMFSMTTHDTEVPSQLFGTVESTAPRYMVCALFSTGKTGIVQGVEYGYPQKVNFIGRSPKLIFESEHDFTEAIANVNELLGTYPVFSRSGNLKFIDDDHSAVIGAYRYSTPGRDYAEFLVFANLDTSSSHELWIDLDKHQIEWSKLEELLTERDIIERKGAFLHIHLAPGGVKAYKISK